MIELTSDITTQQDAKQWARQSFPFHLFHVRSYRYTQTSAIFHTDLLLFVDNKQISSPRHFNRSTLKPAEPSDAERFKV